MISCIDYKRVPYFICVGSAKHNYDCAAPMLGTMLKEVGFRVLGTLDNPIHAQNIQHFVDYINWLQKGYKKKIYQVIGIDASIGNTHTDAYRCFTTPLKPGAGVNKVLPKIGEASIHLNVMRNHKRFSTLRFLLGGFSGSAKEETIDLATEVFTKVAWEFWKSLDKEEYRRHRQAKALEMYLMRGLIYDEIAFQLGVSTGTIHNDIIKNNKDHELLALAKHLTITNRGRKPKKKEGNDNDKILSSNDE